MTDEIAFPGAPSLAVLGVTSISMSTAEAATPDSDLRRAIDPPRPVSEEERAVLDFLLEEPFVGRDELIGQLAGIRVSQECTCGCHSIVFVVAPDAAPMGHSCG